MDAGLKRELEAKVYAGERLTRDDGVALYDERRPGLAGPAGAPRAHRAERRPGDVQRQPAPQPDQRLLAPSCAYCSFQRKPGEKDAYTMRIEEAVAKAKEMEDEQLTELHIVNGLHPTLPWQYYPRVLRELKAALPDVSLKCFTATEIHWFEKISRPAAPTRSSTS